MVPVSPTAQTSSGPLPQTPSRNFVVPLGTGFHVVPFQRRTVSPTAHPSLGPLTQTQSRCDVVPLANAAQPEAVSRRIVPPAPTAHASSRPLPHRPHRSCVVRVGTVDQRS